MNGSRIFIGVRSSVVCIDSNTGATVWERSLDSSGLGEGFVSIALDSERVFAHTRGEVHCLDRATGGVLWTNELEGLGYGIAFVCTDSSPSHYTEAVMKKEQMRSSGG